MNNMSTSWSPSEQDMSQALTMIRNTQCRSNTETFKCNTITLASRGRYSGHCIICDVQTYTYPAYKICHNCVKEVVNFWGNVDEEHCKNLILRYKCGIQFNEYLLDSLYRSQYFLPSFSMQIAHDPTERYNLTNSLCDHMIQNPKQLLYRYYIKYNASLLLFVKKHQHSTISSLPHDIMNIIILFIIQIY